MSQTEARAAEPAPAPQLYPVRLALTQRLAAIAAAVATINEAHAAVITHVQNLIAEDISVARAVTTEGRQAIRNAMHDVRRSTYMLWPDANERIDGPEPEMVFRLPAAIAALHSECDEIARAAQVAYDQARERDLAEEARQKRKARFAQLQDLRAQRAAVLAEGNVPDTVLVEHIRALETEFGISS